MRAARSRLAASEVALQRCLALRRSSRRGCVAASTACCGAWGSASSSDIGGPPRPSSAGGAGRDDHGPRRKCTCETPQAFPSARLARHRCYRCVPLLLPLVPARRGDTGGPLDVDRRGALDRAGARGGRGAVVVPRRPAHPVPLSAGSGGTGSGRGTLQLAHGDRRRLDEVLRQLGQWVGMLGWSLHTPWASLNEPDASAEGKADGESGTDAVSTSRRTIRRTRRCDTLAQRFLPACLSWPAGNRRYRRPPSPALASWLTTQGWRTRAWRRLMGHTCRLATLRTRRRSTSRSTSRVRRRPGSGRARAAAGRPRARPTPARGAGDRAGHDLRLPARDPLVRARTVRRAPGGRRRSGCHHRPAVPGGSAGAGERARQGDLERAGPGPRRPRAAQHTVLGERRSQHYPRPRLRRVQPRPSRSW